MSGALAQRVQKTPRFPRVVRDDLARIAERVAPHAAALSGRRLLITGGSGMLAAYLADSVAFLNDESAFSSPCEILLMVRSAARAEARLGHLFERRDVTLVESDVRAPLPVSLQFDFLVHAAAPSGPADFLADPLASLEANTSALHRLLERAAGSQSALFISSSEVYGTPDPGAIPTSESYVGRVDPLSRRAYYAEAKRAGETYCLAHYEARAVPVKIARPFHVHGPGLRPHDRRIVPALISMALAGRNIELESDGRATRTYGYVADATVALLRLLLSDRNGEAFNVGTDHPETSVLELAQIVADLAGQTEPVRVNTARPASTAEGAPARARPDLSKLREAFAFEPEIGLREGLARTLRWARTRD